MGFWNATLYENDLALDVKEMFEKNIENNKTFDEIYCIMVNKFSQCILSSEAPIFWLVLSDCLWEYGILSEELKNKALLYIKEKALINFFSEVSDKKLWLNSLEKLEKKLLSSHQGNKKIEKNVKKCEFSWNVGDIYAFKFINKSSNNLYNNYIIIQKMAEIIYGDTGTTVSIIKVFNKIFNNIPKITEIINIPILPLSIKFDFYDINNISEEQKQIKEWNIKNSLYGELYFNQKYKIKDKQFTFIGNQKVNNFIIPNISSYLEIKNLESELLKYYNSWNC